MAKIFYARVDEFWRKEEKYAYLDDKQHRGNIDWQEITPDAKHNWLTEGMHDEFGTFLAIGTKTAKKAKGGDAEVVFGNYSRGISTSRDEWIYSFDRVDLENKVTALVDKYNSEVARLSRAGKVTNIDDFVTGAADFLKWTDRLKDALEQGSTLKFSPYQIVRSSYRPFTETICLLRSTSSP